jgi:hypothetical protein
VYDTPRVFGPGPTPRRAPFGHYAAAVRFLHPLSAVALVNAAVVVAAGEGSGNVAILNPVAVRDAYADAPEAPPLVKLIARAAVARATGLPPDRAARPAARATNRNRTVTVASQCVRQHKSASHPNVV